jgi:serine/threonine-protein kinase HipA
VNLDRLRFVEEAVVRKAGVRAGTLRRERGGVVFEYDGDYGGPAVATTLPLSASPVRAPAGAVPPFFAGLLPEGRRLLALRRAIKTSLDDDLSMLLAIGHDTVGDVQVLPSGTEPPPPVEPVGEAGELSFPLLMAAVLGPDPIDRVGLAGVQDKISTAMISLPLSWRGIPSILKLDPPDFPHLVANEAFFLRAAQRSGLSIPPFQVISDRDGVPGLLVERFDRVRTADGIRSRGQEDGCQVLGAYPADKYRLTSEEVLGALARVTGAPAVAARDLVRQAAFAYLSCNGDAHAKNFSIVEQGGEWRTSPAYDLPSSHPYGDGSVALLVHGKDRQDIGRKDFLALGTTLGVPTKAVERVIDELLDAVPSWLPDVGSLPFDPRTTRRLGKAIAYRSRRLEKRRGVATRVASTT